MSEKAIWETVKAEGTELLGKLKKIVREGNVRRVVIKQGDRVVAEFPLSVGVVGTVFAPVLAAIGALVAVLQDCSIEVEKEAPVEDAQPSPPVEPPQPPPEPPASV
jgi:hypothetical protein